MNEKALFLDVTWLAILAKEIKKPYFQALFDFLEEQRNSGKVVFPQQTDIFNAFNLTSLNNIKVVILGQDPYHGEGQANGLSFSVKKGVRIPPSLRNIYKELYDDIGCLAPSHGDLSKWANQGVLLLNSVLSVEHSLAASHKNKGWEIFTDQVITEINAHCENVVFMLWGAYAQKKGKMIDQTRHLVLESVHPSPLSAHRGFLGCKHFSKANMYLQQQDLTAIDWRID